MRKLFVLTALVIFCSCYTNAQDGSQTGKDGWLIEINTGFGEASTSNTGFALRSVDGNTAWGLGGEAGYFIFDNFALKAGIGYADSNVGDGVFNWKFGGKYYIVNRIPVALDINGASGNSFSPLWFGIQGGYALFITDKVSIEPGLRYGIGLNEDAGDGDFNIFSLNIGFNIFL